MSTIAGLEVSAYASLEAARADLATDLPGVELQYLGIWHEPAVPEAGQYIFTDTPELFYAWGWIKEDDPA